MPLTSIADQMSLWHLVNFSYKQKARLHVPFAYRYMTQFRQPKSHHFRRVEYANSHSLQKEYCMYPKKREILRQVDRWYFTQKKQTFESLPGFEEGSAREPPKEAACPPSCQQRLARWVVLSDRWRTRHHYDQYTVNTCAEGSHGCEAPLPPQTWFCLCGPLQLCCVDSLFPMAGRKRCRGTSIFNFEYFHSGLMKEFCPIKDLLVVLLPAMIQLQF